MEIVIFKMAGEEFGVKVDQVKEVLPVSNINPLPQTPDFIEGIMTVRQHSIVIVDLRKKFNLSVGTDNPAGNVIVVKVEGMIVGCMVDRVDDVLDVDEQQIDSGLGMSADYIDESLVTGTVHIGDRVIILLDLNKIFKPRERDVFEKTIQ